MNRCHAVPAAFDAAICGRLPRPDSAREAGPVAANGGAKAGTAQRAALLQLPLLRAALALVLLVPALHVAAAPDAQRPEQAALESFRLGRFPEAYGRFIQLANAGRAAAARYALWMCEHGPDLFGRDWDCSPDDVENWSGLAQVNGPIPSTLKAGLDAARQLYEDCHWAAAFQAFSRLADAGDPDAARIAMEMMRHGKRLYGQAFDLPAARAARWPLTPDDVRLSRR